MLRWIIKIGRIDILFEISFLSRYLPFTRTKHLGQALHISKYLEIHNVNDIDFYPCYQSVTSDQDIKSKVHVMKDLYVHAGE